MKNYEDGTTPIRPKRRPQEEEDLTKRVPQREWPCWPGSEDPTKSPVAAYGPTKGTIDLTIHPAKEFGPAKGTIDPAPEKTPVQAPAKTTDPVNHPDHYTGNPSGIECIQVVEHLGFCVGNAIKYLWRAGQKGAILEDLRKARWYIDREISRIERVGK